MVSKCFKNNLGFLHDAIENLFIANATVHGCNTRNRHKLRAAHGHISVLGYEPAGLTVHPPPPRMIEGGFILFAWVSSATKIFS